MVSSSEELRSKFMTEECPDGIDVCLELIRAAGGAVSRGVITMNHRAAVEAGVEDAILFLYEEWDFGWRGQSPFQEFMRNAEALVTCKGASTYSRL
jgi:hypothetical protein